MKRFVGTFDHSVDSKSRLAVPADFRALMQQGNDPVFLFVTLADYGGLSLYTEEAYEKLLSDLEAADAADPHEQVEFLEMLQQTTYRVELDKAGRVRLPDQLLKEEGVELGTEVAVAGTGDHVEVHQRQAFYERRAQQLRQRMRSSRSMNPKRALLGKPAKQPDQPLAE